MDGYEMIVESLEVVLQRENIGESDKDNIRKQISSLKTVSGKTEVEIDLIFNTGAFNQIIKGYFLTAMKNCEVKKYAEVMDELNWLLDTMGASEARKKV